LTTITATARAVLRRTGYDIVRYPPFNRRHELGAEIARLTNNTVTSGLFAGLILTEHESSGTNMGSKLLGLYESELYETLNDVVRAVPDVVVNVGCAEGFYAIGLARLIPEVNVIAYDVNTEAQRICAEGARKNAVNRLLDVRGRCTSTELRNLTETARRPFILIDCEGGERELLLSTDYNYKNSRMIIECHDFIDPHITRDLVDKFTKTHNIERISQGGKNPFLCELTKRWPEDDLWSIVSEHRPERMHWLHLTPLIDPR
jgi:hypothetical protein